MPSKELLGSSEKDQFELLSKINRDRKNWRRQNPKGYARYVKSKLLPKDTKPELDEDIVAISNRLINRVGAQFEIERIEKLPERGFVNTKELTSYGLLREDVNRAYRRGDRVGVFHCGPGITKEMMILWLFFQIAIEYAGTKNSSYIHFTGEEVKKVIKADKYVHKKIFKEHRWDFKYDDYWHLTFDWVRWFKSLNDDFQHIGEVIGKDLLLNLIVGASFNVKGKKLLKPLEEAEKNISGYNWVTLCSMIYTIRCMEKDAPGPILRSDLELRKIWKIPRDTYRRRMDFFASIDEGD